MRTNSKYSFEQVGVPAGWTGEADIEMFEDLYGSATDYFAEAMEHVNDAKSDFVAALKEALTFFGVQPKSIATTNVTARIVWLESHVVAKVPSCQLRSWLLEDLAYCQHVHREYERLMGPEKAPQEQTWLAIWIGLGDHLSTAASGLEDTLDYAKRQPGGSKWL